ncbi:DUF4179 domain-containing protein [Robertmurraya korlensis]|uniref:DUF4179 domain-containing protein n=1 Tax=Robertmurraya korlensis TaxID=519977 RepID=UPI000826AD8A|nr:DUF4179 domain-containing protein [Robertmurraya korlensis]
MNCPTADKLSMYVDNLLSEDEMIEIHNHLKNCSGCDHIVEWFQGEQQFVKETLQSPQLPDDFASTILEQIEPYEQKIGKKRFQSNRVIGLAAGVVLAVGLTTSLNPSFAEWVEGLFSSDQVDEGLRIANEAGIADRVNQIATDQGISFKVEDVIADSSRIALSYQVLSDKGELKDSSLELDNMKNKISVYGTDGNPLEISSMGWSGGSDYGLIEISLRDQKEIGELVVHFNLSLLNGEEGTWNLEVPVDLKESQKMTTNVQLHEYKNSFNGVNIQMKEARFAPSSSELMYETSFSNDEWSMLNKQNQALAKKIGKGISDTGQYGTAIQYHIENEEGEMVSGHNLFTEEKGHPTDSGMIQGSGQGTGVMGQNEWNESFVPQKDEGNLTFVLDGVIKTVPSDFSIQIKPSDLKKKPVTFEYEGNHMTIKKAEKQTNYSLKKSLWPIEKDVEFEIEMDGGKEWLSSDLGEWVIVDDKGNSYQAYQSTSILDEKDENGRFKTTVKLGANGLKELPEELTLHLITVTRYHEVKEKWKIPLYNETE